MKGKDQEQRTKSRNRYRHRYGHEQERFAIGTRGTLTIAMVAIFAILLNFGFSKSTLQDYKRRPGVYDERDDRQLSTQMQRRQPRKPRPLTNRRVDPLFAKGPWDSSPLVNEEYKLIFYTIPKTGTTVFKQLFRRMKNISDWHVQKDPHIPHNPYMNNLTYLYDYPRDRAREFLVSPEWTKAIFLRDPKERLLSAYMDKALRENGWYVREKCCQITKFKPNGTPKTRQDPKCAALVPFKKNITEEVFPFEKFVKEFLHSCKDPHWNPQAGRLPPYAWKQINFVGQFSNIQNDTRKLLQKVGAWEKYGSNGWPGGEIFSENSMDHKTSSADHIDDMFNPELERQVFEYYREDYEHPVMNFTKPPNFPKKTGLDFNTLFNITGSFLPALQAQRRNPPPPPPPPPKPTGPYAALLERGPWDNSPIVDEKHKLIFFTIPKTGTTVFKQLFRRMKGLRDWNIHREPDIPHNPWRNRLKYLYHYPNGQVAEFMTSPEWTRAIFLRDPKERVLSAYMDKALSENGWYVKAKCCQITKQFPHGGNKTKTDRKCDILSPWTKNMTAETFPFDVFVNEFMHTCQDPHWKPQAKRLEKNAWEKINFVGYFSNIQNDTRKLLKQIGAWEEFGASGWPGGEIFAKNSAKHKTSSRKHVDEFYTPELEKRVYQFYREDYEHPIMNLTKPSNFHERIGNETITLFGRPELDNGTIVHGGDILHTGDSMVLLANITVSYDSSHNEVNQTKSSSNDQVLNHTIKHHNDSGGGEKSKVEHAEQHLNVTTPSNFFVTDRNETKLLFGELDSNHTILKVAG